MAKGIGLIGNFRGKVGNMVGYNLKDSNNKQTQGVRVYQPVVKNPKSYGQAEQRSKLAVINFTYRELKAVIDRGQESKAYGNKSRLAWLSQALKAFNGGWQIKGEADLYPAIVPVTKGTLSVNFETRVTEDGLKLVFSNPPETAPTTIGALSKVLMDSYPSLQVGDQLTFVIVATPDSLGATFIGSIILTEATDTTAMPAWLTADTTAVVTLNSTTPAAGAIILSREGSGGQHLRNSASLIAADEYPADLMSAEGKETAIRSYMAGGVNSDWPEESVQ